MTEEIKKSINNMLQNPETWHDHSEDKYYKNLNYYFALKIAALSKREHIEITSYNSGRYKTNGFSASFNYKGKKFRLCEYGLVLSADYIRTTKSEGSYWKDYEADRKITYYEQQGRLEEMVIKLNEYIEKLLDMLSAMIEIGRTCEERRNSEKIKEQERAKALQLIYQID